MAKENKLQIFHTIKELKAFETVSPKVSAKYVPIYTSELIKILEPEFTLVNGCKPYPSYTTHYVDLVNETGDTIRIYNSFDRRWALSVNLISDGLTIKLGTDRLIHMGQKATNFTEDFEDAKQSILDAIVNAKTFAGVLASTKIEKDLAKAITDSVFRNFIKKDGFQEIVNYADILIEKDITVKNYINTTLKNFAEGNYTVTISGKKRVGRKSSNVFEEVLNKSKIMKLVENEYLEYLL